MCVEKPSGMDYARAWVSNWRESDDPFALKIWHVTRNYSKRVRHCLPAAVMMAK